MDAAAGSLPFITWQVVDRLLALLRECRRRGEIEPTVLPDSNGGVRLVWTVADGSRVEVELLNAGRMVLHGTMTEGRFSPADIMDSVTGPVIPVVSTMSVVGKPL